MNVLVTDGENRSALAVTRSLGRNGCTVMVTESVAGSIAACSRYCSYAYQVPNPMEDCDGYVSAIAALVIRENVDVVIPMTEQSVYCLNRNRELLGKNVILACASSDHMDAVSNKFKLFQLASNIGISIPQTLFIDGQDEYHRQKVSITRYPVVVKPAFSKIREGDRIISAGVMYASNAQELDRLYEARPVLRYPSLIQELIVGEGTGLFTLFDHDRHLALFAHRRILEKPPSGGVSVLSESIPLDKQMVEDAEKLLSAVDWTGIAMVEFKRDVRDGKAKLMEINGRFWGSLQLAVSSGINFPVLSLEYHLGRKLEQTCRDYRTGVRLKWLFGMLDHLIIRLKNRGPSAAMPVDIPPVMQVMRDLLVPGGANTAGDVYDFDDLQPFISEAKSYFRNVAGI
ncbi:carboxylate--amine ligase [Pelotalea chapellei]|uniref:ATP-grasp domain-containing protein n=1 Tax=Pelotalea chapellei TaxID=44671 RepID=A0ABS5U831_9BACT|nr:ATP-grasp domain-containing protein [Pelotalea chapellei]MBT1071827.1 ATP-grasp domain-containing protein [Pelotalea chapellei]